MTARDRFAMGVAGVVVLAAAALCTAADAPAKGSLAELVARMPDPPANSKVRGPDWAEAQKVYDEILKGGRANVVALVDMVVEPGQTRNFQPRYVLAGLAAYLARPGLAQQRRMFVEALGSTLGTKRPEAVQGFVARQLQAIGDASACAALGKVLGEAELCEYAAQGLSAIGGPAAAGELRKALPSAKGAVRMTIIRALGEVRDSQSVGPLVQALLDADRDTRLTAAVALGNIGDPAAADVMLKAAETASPYERAEGTAACLMLGRRLAEAGRKDDAAKVYLRLWKTRTDPADVHVRCAALGGLADVPTAEAIEVIAGALSSTDARIRDAAVTAAAARSGKEATRRWLAELKTAPPDRRAMVLRILGDRRDPLALPAVLEAAEDSDGPVRAAAALAAGRIGGEEALDALMGLLEDKDSKVAGAARDACRQMPGDAAAARMAAALAGAPAGRKKQLLAILAARGAKGHLAVVVASADDKDPAVRAEAIRAVGLLGGEKDAPMLLKRLLGAKDAADRDAAGKALASIGRGAADRDAVAKLVVAKLDGAAGGTRTALIRVLGNIAAPAGLDALRAAAKAPDGEAREAAVRALADWPDDTPADDLLPIAKAPGDQTLQVLALRGYVRMIRESRAPAGERIKRCRAALAAAARPDERKLVLAVLGGIQTGESLKVVAPYLDEPALAEEAGAAATGIADQMQASDPQAVQPVLEKVLAKCKDERVRDRAAKALDRLKR